jgi:N-acetylglutamate synthase-like GNAT family acetyltransferase
MNSPTKLEENLPFGDVEIRTAQAGDIPWIASLDEKTTGQAKRQYWQDLFTDFQQSRGNGRAFLVAEQHGRVVGFITGEVRAFEFGSEPCGWVFALNVDQEIRVHNVGTRLFEALCETFRQAGIEKVRTMLKRDNHLVQAFFRSLGMMAGPFIQLEKDLD